MSQIDIIQTSVKTGNGTDYKLGANKNQQSAEKVQAYVDCFLPYAIKASEQLNNLPVKLILAQWGLESGWGATSVSVDSQNWGGIKGGKQPSSTKKTLSNGNTIFYGINGFVEGYVYILKTVKNYVKLMNYLENSFDPQIQDCIKLLADSGYSTDTALQYQKLLNDCLKAIDKYTDFHKKYII